MNWSRTEVTAEKRLNRRQEKYYVAVLKDFGHVASDPWPWFCRELRKTFRTATAAKMYGERYLARLRK